jgi:ABC-2 type transport system ATP-binding protein
MGGIMIHVSHLRKEFPGVTALDAISFDVKKGELFGILGPNGSGKSTLIRILTGQIKPTKGFVKVQGKNPEKEPIQVRSLVGIIPEQENPPSFLTAIEYLEFVAKIRKIKNVSEKIEHWFSFLDFEDQKNILCKDLSRGTRQKLMFAQAFLHEPDLAFIDEPLINLDPIAQKKVKEFLTAQVKKGKTIFFSTHVLEIAQEICSTIGILDKGKLLHVGPIASLKHKKLENFFIKLVQK